MHGLVLLDIYVGSNMLFISNASTNLVNGAGLAMATMDIIKLHGGEPANFLDGTLKARVFIKLDINFSWWWCHCGTSDRSF